MAFSMKRPYQSKPFSEISTMHQGQVSALNQLTYGEHRGRPRMFRDKITYWHCYRRSVFIVRDPNLEELFSVFIIYRQTSSLKISMVQRFTFSIRDVGELLAVEEYSNAIVHVAYTSK